MRAYDTAQVISGTPGPHKGWFTLVFRVDGQRYKLLTIDNPDRPLKKPCSYLSEVDEQDNSLPRAPIWSFHCVLPLEDAYTIIRLIHTAEDDGYERGVREARKTMREALGL